MGKGHIRDIKQAKEKRLQEMYSRVRYPGLDPEANAIYVRHRRFVYRRLGLDVDGFFRGKTVLDAGCGTGEETLFLANLGPEKIIGIDTSKGSLEAANKAADRAGITNVEFRCVSVLDGAVFPGESFDYVSSLGCIHHTPDMPGSFKNLARWVKPGGHLCTFIYNSFGHFFYNIECGFLDRWVGENVDARVLLARRLFDWKCNKTFYREGVASSYDARLYDKYGVLYRESLTLKKLLFWYQAEGFNHVGSFPMYLKDMLEALRARDQDGSLPDGTKGKIAGLLERFLRTDIGEREWTWGRRFSMQGLLLLMGIYDYGSAFRVLGQKKN